MRPAAYQHAGPATRAATHPAAAPPSGLLAALTLLLVAWTNVSLGVGLLYLAAFLTWAASCAPAAARGGAGAKRLWATVSGLSALCLLVQLFLQARPCVDCHFFFENCCMPVGGPQFATYSLQRTRTSSVPPPTISVQAAFLLGAPGLAAVAPVLRLLGFPVPRGTADVLLVSLAAALLAAIRA